MGRRDSSTDKYVEYPIHARFLRMSGNPRISALIPDTPEGTLNYTYDAANRTNVTELNGRSINWSYDGIYRLNGESIASDPLKANANITYILDPVGNRSSETSTPTLSSLNPGSFSFNPDDQELIESYDADGNTTATGEYELRLRFRGSAEVVVFPVPAQKCPRHVASPAGLIRTLLVMAVTMGAPFPAYSATPFSHH